MLVQPLAINTARQPGALLVVELPAAESRPSPTLVAPPHTSRFSFVARSLGGFFTAVPEVPVVGPGLAYTCKLVPRTCIVFTRGGVSDGPADRAVFFCGG